MREMMRDTTCGCKFQKVSRDTVWGGVRVSSQRESRRTLGKKNPFERFTTLRKLSLVFPRCRVFPYTLWMPTTRTMPPPLPHLVAYSTCWDVGHGSKRLYRIWVAHRVDLSGFCWLYCGLSTWSGWASFCSETAYRPMVLRHIIFDLSTRRPQIIGSSGHVRTCFLDFRISKNVPRILSFKTKNFYQKSTKNHQNKITGLRPALPSGNYLCNIMSFNCKRHNNTYEFLQRHNSVLQNCMTFLCHKF